MNMKIYVAGHKKFSPPEDNVYVPIIGGMNNHCETENFEGFLGDNTGDNISSLNPYFCELTVQYWIWKNDRDSSVVGLSHYRRFFSKKNVGTNIFYTGTKEEKITFEDHDIASGNDFDFSKIDIVLPSKFKVSSPIDQYKNAHVIEDFFMVREKIKKIHPDYLDAYDFYVNFCDYFYHTNMIIAKKEIFNEYSSWLFSLLLPLSDKKFFSNYDDYQKRIFGFLSERLLCIWILKNRERFCIEERPLVHLFHLY